MSFILDALKKAEAERNRHIAPVLMDARVAPPRRGLPAWAWVLGAVLLVNLVALGWLLWRTPAPTGTVQVRTDVAAGEALPDAASATAPAPAAPGSGSTPTATPPLPTITPPTSQAPPALPGIATASSASSATGAGQPADFDRLPSLHALRTAGVALPDLQLNLHVYDPAPAYRSVLLNGQRLREGEYTPNGVKVEYITPVGVVLEAAGRRFRLDVGD